MHNARWVLAFSMLLLMACGEDAASSTAAGGLTTSGGGEASATSSSAAANGGQGGSASSAGGGGSGGSTTVTFTVYTDSACTKLPPQNSTVVLDASKSCNSTPDASISELVCYKDRITYTNHPNNSDCSSAGIANELPVGKCTQFPGPVATWKLIEAVSYTCLTAP
jgi:hypothetical protein